MKKSGQNFLDFFKNKDDRKKNLKLMHIFKISHHGRFGLEKIKYRTK